MSIISNTTSGSVVSYKAQQTPRTQQAERLQDLSKKINDRIDTDSYLQEAGLVGRLVRRFDEKKDPIDESVLYSVDLQREIPEKYREALELFETKLLPEILLKNFSESMGQTLQEMSQRLWTLLGAWGEVEIEQTPTNSNIIRNSYGDEKLELPLGKEAFLAQFKMMLHMHASPTFKPIRSFSGNVGWMPNAMKQVVEQGNPRESLFFIINVIRNALKPRMKELKEDGRLDDFLRSLSEKLDWEIPEGFEITPGNLFEFGKSLRIREDKDWPRATLKAAQSATQLIQMSKREIRYAKERADEKGDGKVYWGSAASKYRPKELKEEPDNPFLQAIEESGLRKICSISGVTADIFASLPMLGLGENTELKYILRLACLALLLEGKNHSGVEVCLSAADHGVPFVLTPDYYLDLLPQDHPLCDVYLEALENHFPEQPLPHTLLSN